MKQPTAAERRRYDTITKLGCIVGMCVTRIGCAGRVTVHHCFTGAGGRKQHRLTIPLCWGHHLGAEGIDGKRMSKRAWQTKYGSEAVLLEETEKLLGSGHDRIYSISEA